MINVYVPSGSQKPRIQRESPTMPPPHSEYTQRNFGLMILLQAGVARSFYLILLALGTISRPLPPGRRKDWG